MFNHVSEETARSCLESLVQLNREGDVDAILSFIGVLDEAADNPIGEVLLSAVAQIGKAPAQKRD